MRAQTFIIAEIGSNHNGDLNTAKALIREASINGATAAKFQLWRCEDILYGNPDGFRKYELPLEWLPELAEHCRIWAIEFMCTPFSPGAVEALQPWVKRWKVASFEAGRLDLRDAILATSKPVIVSDGRSSPAAIRQFWGKCSVLRCISEYPADVTGYLSDFSWVDGLSDHTLSLTLPAAAVVLGARIVEKHLTLSRNQQGPDHGHSLEPHEFQEMVTSILEVENALYRARPALKEYPARREWILKEKSIA